MSEPRYPGARVRVSWTVTDETQDPAELADPDAQEVRYGRIGDDPTVVEWPGVDIIHDGTGLFHLDIDCPLVGHYAADIESTEGVVGSTQVTWRISKPAFVSV